MRRGTSAAIELSRQRCHLHAGREAVARCPQCRRFFCRECVTEHDGRMVCAACLQDAVGRGTQPGTWWQLFGLIVPALLGFLGIWSAMYIAGQLLLRTPTAFHDGTVWESVIWDE